MYCVMRARKASRFHKAMGEILRRTSLPCWLPVVVSSWRKDAVAVSLIGPKPLKGGQGSQAPPPHRSIVTRTLLQRTLTTARLPMGTFLRST